MSNFHLVLMHREALRRLADAKVLSDRGDSAHLLCLIGLELLLKLIHEVTLRRKTTHGHKYELIFRYLPIEIQEEIIKRAGARIGPSALNSGALKILREWGKNFVNLRYPYEKYEGLTEKEYSALGEDWLKAGTSLEEAHFRYFPEELFGLVDTLKGMAEDMAKNSYWHENK